MTGEGKIGILLPLGHHEVYRFLLTGICSQSSGGGSTSTCISTHLEFQYRLLHTGLSLAVSTGSQSFSRPFYLLLGLVQKVLGTCITTASRLQNIFYEGLIISGNRPDSQAAGFISVKVRGFQKANAIIDNGRPRPSGRRGWC
jgi:hypothetical protein